MSNDKNNPQLLPCPVCKTHPLFLESNLFSRPQRWTQNDHIRWMCACPSRSGSTVVFQLMNLFDDGATVKTHSIKQPDCPLLLNLKGTVCTVRHPYDMFASLFYMFKKRKPEDFKIEENQDIIEKFDREFSTTIGLIAYNDKLISLYKLYGIELSKVLFLKYEDCIKDPLLRVEKLSSFMGKNLTKDEVKKIAEEYSVNKNIERIKEGEHRTIDIKGTEKTKHIYFESNHIGPNKGMSQGNKLPTDVKEMIVTRYNTIFTSFNYRK